MFPSQQPVREILALRVQNRDDADRAAEVPGVAPEGSVSQELADQGLLAAPRCVGQAVEGRSLVFGQPHEERRSLLGHAGDEMR
jgi:hypothetical protein